MSGGRYRDLETVSTNGQYRLTAQSEDNLPGGHGYARNFEYRMWNGAGELCWQRSAPVGEPSPLEIVVADDGRVEYLLGPRPRIKALLRLMDAPTSPEPTYGFTEKGAKLTLPNLEKPDFANLVVGQTARKVLELVGSPDFNDQRYGEGTRKWTETWEFDHRLDHWSCVKIRWDTTVRTPVVRSLSTSAPDWEYRENCLSSFVW